MFLKGDDFPDGFHVDVGDASFSFFGKKKPAIFEVVHKKVFGEYGRADGISEYRKIAVPVGIAVGMVAPHSEKSGELFFGFFPQQGGIKIADFFQQYIFVQVLRQMICPFWLSACCSVYWFYSDIFLYLHEQRVNYVISNTFITHKM